MRIIIMILLAVLCLTPVTAENSFPDFSIYNQYGSAMAAAAPLEDTPTIKEGTYGCTNYRFNVADKIYVTIMTDASGDAKGCGVIGLLGADAAEFLAQSVTACYYLGRIESGLYCYDPILSQFMECRVGRTTDPSNIGSLMCSVKREDDGYLFFAMKQKYDLHKTVLGTI